MRYQLSNRKQARSKVLFKKRPTDGVMEVEEISVDETPEYPQAIMPAQAKGGRPTKYRPEMVRKLLELIQKGIPYAPACRSLGISYRTMRRWVEKGERPGSPEPFRQFCHDIRRASAEAEGRLAAQWLALAEEKREWRGIWRYMACRWPQRWSERRQLEESKPQAPLEKPLELTNLSNMPIKDVRKLRDLLEQARALDTKAKPG